MAQSSSHGSRTTGFFRPAVTLDVVVFRPGPTGIEALLIERGNQPFKGFWALPGGFLDEEDQTLEEGALRELAEETGVIGHGLAQLGSFGNVGRDPRGRTVTVAYLCLAEPQTEAVADSDAARAGWFCVQLAGGGRAHACEADGGRINLAFDHDLVLGQALRQLQKQAAAAQPFLALLRPSWTAKEAANLARAVELIAP